MKKWCIVAYPEEGLPRREAIVAASTHTSLLYGKALTSFQNTTRLVHTKWRKNDVLFVSKKKYEALLEQKKDFERIASNAVAQNGRLLEEWDTAIKEMKSIQELNHGLVNHNDELLAHCKELEAKLGFATRHIQLADDTIFDIEDALYRHKGDGVIQLHIDEYYEEVKLLDTK